MSDFYERLTKHKADNRLTNKEIADLLGMNEPAFRAAVARQSLNSYQVKELENLLEETPQKNPLKAGLELNLDVFVDYILAHPEVRNLHPRFKVYCDLLAAEAKIEYMEKRYGNG